MGELSREVCWKQLAMGKQWRRKRDGVGFRRKGRGTRMGKGKRKRKKRKSVNIVGEMEKTLQEAWTLDKGKI